ncbi:MAG: glycosyltransferase family 2 protein, partial [Cytophagales bacterium]|nr:glycosyltransferase family 2 protein [Cytophagales bacterium]
MKDLISIIVPNYNGEETIGKCLDAIYASTNDNFEVVVVDDCSTDGSVGIIRQYPCRLIELKENAGASKARNKGAENCKGDILFFTDADCVFQENTIDLAIETMRDSETD